MRPEHDRPSTARPTEDRAARAVPAAFADDFVRDLDRLFAWRRDVRAFRPDPPPEALLTESLAAMRLAPSVGLSEPWRLLRIESDGARAACLANFEAANQAALAGYRGEQAQLYATLKLSGMREAPIQLAVFCDDATAKGSKLGARSMPETRAYSVVGAITLFWLALRARGLGLGWVSILDPERVSRDLAVPQGWTFVAYLCVGWAQEASESPELERQGWERRADRLEIETR
ncbi:MAG: 5,6-dimethylbenzimidazole synthase [Pseudomonadota bacterium]